jgi:hypothetical protein
MLGISFSPGGSILALSLVPQVIKLLLTRSAADISLLWSLLYLLGEQQGSQGDSYIALHSAYIMLCTARNCGSY